MTRPLRGVALRAHVDAIDRRQEVLEDYEFLIETGETNPEMIAQRLGFNSVNTLDRYLYRNNIPLKHHRGIAA